MFDKMVHMTTWFRIRIVWFDNAFIGPVVRWAVSSQQLGVSPLLWSRSVLVGTGSYQKTMSMSMSTFGERERGHLQELLLLLLRVSMLCQAYCEDRKKCLHSSLLLLLLLLHYIKKTKSKSAAVLPRSGTTSKQTKLRSFKEVEISAMNFEDMLKNAMVMSSHGSSQNKAPTFLCGETISSAAWFSPPQPPQILFQRNRLLKTDVTIQ